MKFDVYNLVFPPFCPRLEVAGFVFTRVPEYRDRVRQLQHQIPSIGEFQLERGIGTHAHTAVAERDGASGDSVFFADSPGSSSLSDVLLLLSILLKRDIFVCESQMPVSDRHPLWHDPRPHAGGGLLRCGLPYVAVPCCDPDERERYDGGLELGLNRIHSLITSPEWREKYQSGHFLILARNSFREQPIESRFTLSWSIWEHLFALRHRHWLNDGELRRLPVKSKLAYIFAEYVLATKQATKEVRKAIDRLAKLRNRLVHFGMLPQTESAIGDALLFTELTEVVVGRTLGIDIGGVSDTWGRLNDLLADERVWTPYEILTGQRPEAEQTGR